MSDKTTTTLTMKFNTEDGSIAKTSISGTKTQLEASRVRRMMQDMVDKSLLTIGATSPAGAHLTTTMTKELF